MEKELIMNIAILQARMSSSRLPEKVLKEVEGKPLLLFECERLLLSKKIDKLIIATSEDSSDDPLEVFGKTIGLDVYRGSLDDVLNRYYSCITSFIEKNKLEKEDINIIRVTGDCPIIDPEVIDEVVDKFEKNNCDYCSNTLTPTYPDGMDVEVCTFSALEYAFNNAEYKSDREHVTLFIKNCEKFSKLNYIASVDFSHLRMTVDEDKDFLLIKIILENLYTVNPKFTYLEAISFMTKNPDMFYINSGIPRDEGLAKSLKEDGRI